MPRAPRLVIPGQPLHVVQRGNNRTTSFAATADFDYYRSVLHEASEVAGCAIHAYVLMTNHVHLLLTPGDELAPARMMQAIGRRYVRYFNVRRARTGTLWEGRYRSILIDSERYLLACSRYVELNPTRAGLVARPDQYPWSSFRRNAHGEHDALITPHAVYSALGRLAAERQAAYRAMFASCSDGETAEAIRSATNKGTVLGGSSFREAVETVCRRRVERQTHGGDRRSTSFRERAYSRTLTP